jgi:hypothetical protein
METYLCPARLNPVPVSVCLEKSSTPFLPNGWFQSCLLKSTDPTGELHTPHGNIVHCSTCQIDIPTAPPNKTEKHKQWIVNYHQQWGWDGMLNQHWRMGVGQEVELSEREGRAKNKVWEQGWSNKPNSQSQGKADHWANPMGLKAVLHKELPTWWGRIWSDRIVA